ncbi:DUF1489 family protein [Inquilinus limosus]|uniref:Lysophospholipase n=1 Tax=Inquilinus limosus MP06 TaxID=1398085 RepID=A0A0A0CXJ9_9PROT|nr:DUF1489 domain-containing protein [Inquilinus limosus]KGM31186.1 hypothetical protein P409_28640 [Inquilinus limosus MP06]
MPVHLLKVAVGISEPAQLATVQQGRRHVVDGREVVYGYTKRMPTRRDDLIDGGSIFWVIRHVILVRQPILDMFMVTDEDGDTYCRLLYHPELTAVEARPLRAFQGWRYLDPETAPRDLGASSESDLPAHLQQELRALGLL